MPDTDVRFPSFDLKGQVALVTGAARGLGNSIAIALAQAGADVALGLRDIKTGGELVSAIKSIGRRVVPLQMDIEKRSEITSAVAEAVKQFGRIDILVNNAGIGPANPAEDVTEADFDYLRRQPQGDVLREPGGGPGDDQAARRQDRHARIAGRLRGSPPSRSTACPRPPSTT